jgi:addiction module RelE/StbE family toxin
MIVFLHKNFIKKYKKLRKAEKQRFQERKNILINDPFCPILQNHRLRGEWEGYGSINIGGALRAIYFYENPNTVKFVNIDTHGNLYQ